MKRTLTELERLANQSEILLIDAEYSLEEARIRLDLAREMYIFTRKEALAHRRAMLVARNEEQNENPSTTA